MSDLMDIARQIPMGFECRSCGASAYNHVIRIARYLKTGEPCCGDFRDWAARADAPGAQRLSSQQLSTTQEN